MKRPSAATVFVMPGDGNVVQYAPGGGAACSFRTSYRSSAYLRAMPEGNLVVHHNGTAVWAKSWGSRCL